MEMYEDADDDDNDEGAMTTSWSLNTFKLKYFFPFFFTEVRMHQGHISM